MSEQTLKIERICATGYPPETIRYTHSATATRVLYDKRTVSVRVFDRRLGYSAEIRYQTEWRKEVPWVWLFHARNVEDLAKRVREKAESIDGFLPPGAGYPSTPSYEARQRKLIGAVNSHVLTCLTESLAQVAQDD